MQIVPELVLRVVLIGVEEPHPAKTLVLKCPERGITSDPITSNQRLEDVWRPIENCMDFRSCLCA